MHAGGSAGMLSLAARYNTWLLIEINVERRSLFFSFHAWYLGQTESWQAQSRTCTNEETTPASCPTLLPTYTAYMTKVLSSPGLSLFSTTKRAPYHNTQMMPPVAHQHMKL